MMTYTEMRYKRLAANKAANELRKKKKPTKRSKNYYQEKIEEARRVARAITMERFEARI